MDRYGYVLEKLFNCNIDKYGILRLYNLKSQYSSRDVESALKEFFSNSTEPITIGGLVMGNFKGEFAVGNGEAKYSDGDDVRACMYLYLNTVNKCNGDYIVKTESKEYTPAIINEDLMPFWYVRTNMFNESDELRKLLYSNVDSIFQASNMLILRMLLQRSFYSAEEIIEYVDKNSSGINKQINYGLIREMLPYLKFTGDDHYYIDRKPFFRKIDSEEYNALLNTFCNAKRNNNGLLLTSINKEDTNYNKILYTLINNEPLFVLDGIFCSDIMRIAKTHRDNNLLQRTLSSIRELNYKEFNTDYILINECKYGINLLDLYENNRELYDCIYYRVPINQLSCFKYLERRVFEGFPSTEEFIRYLELINTVESMEVKDFVIHLIKKYNIFKDEESINQRVELSSSFGGKRFE